MKRRVLLACWLIPALGGPLAAKHYFVSIPPEGRAKYKEANFALWIPEGLDMLRAVIVHQHGCGEPAETAGATATFDLQWQALARKWDCALMGSNYRMDTGCNDWCFPENGSETAFLQALARFAEQSGHEELTRVPWALWGHSGGAEWVYRMFTHHPERVLVLVLRSGPPFMEMMYTESLATPMLYNIGVKEKGDERFGRIWQKATDLFEARRALGALDTWAPDPEASHDCRFGRLLVIPYIDACLAQRLGPPGSALMAPMDMARAWFGNIETFETGAAAQYDGEPNKVTWLPNERIASMWKEFVKTGWVTDETPPPAPTDLEATVVDANCLTLRWQAQADLDSGIKTFRIYRNGDRTTMYTGSAPDLFQKPNYHDTLEEPLREMVCTDSDVIAGTTYTYEITTVNWCELESPRSGPVTVTLGR